ncbi:hypothetical protein NWP17_09775 [Chrysosporum bergii ANA360D]|uniref:Uncharacterized protein n=1 Tax=Chrysosporum bergii ANA360D TaxID=617107 RepID=A0AA43GSM9_9CYAN|nr:hypothetical protein [Chrysosporum bergii]MDH6060726.1 hypothetical protein [Chrysosporum bergii ANA360D]
MINLTLTTAKAEGFQRQSRSLVLLHLRPAEVEGTSLLALTNSYSARH